ncbi:ectonucleotide pyrophosphatase/phosphodiesterase [Saccharicrinis sp. FJH2]|uniref:alkaline phosphatase family protein n=1 Tax=Saccharicrinis sp. FJH65 TaxID=3344659 RepID=UPI0035F42B1D
MKQTILLLVILAFSAACKPPKGNEKPAYVVVLSMDGFRWDYTSRTSTPAFDELAADGVKAEYMVPSFPTKTFPNHYTLATGLYPGEHGIVANSFYNDSLKKSYSLGNRAAVQDADFYGGEPIWVTAEKYGIKAATCFWPGSEAPIKGVRPSYWLKYDGSLTYQSRLDTVVYWLTLPYSQRPHLVMFYVDEPDHTAHSFGPDSKEVTEEISSLDNYLAAVQKKLFSLDIADSIDFILLSDHGMAKVNMDKSYDLSQLLPAAWVVHQSTSNPLALIDPAPGFADSIVATLNKVKGIRAWLKKDVPAKYHYNSHPAIPGVVALADSSYTLYWKKYTLAADHGYDPDTNSDMRTIFYAKGSDFKKDFINKPFSNRMIYPLITKLLGIPTEKSLEALKNEHVEVTK